MLFAGETSGRKIGQHLARRTVVDTMTGRDEEKIDELFEDRVARLMDGKDDRVCNGEQSQIVTLMILATDVLSSIIDPSTRLHSAQSMSRDLQQIESNRENS